MAEITAYIGLGSNLGDREYNIKKAIEKLSQAEGIEVLAISEFIESVTIGLYGYTSENHSYIFKRISVKSDNSS